MSKQLICALVIALNCFACGDDEPFSVQPPALADSPGAVSASCEEPSDQALVRFSLVDSSQSLISPYEEAFGFDPTSVRVENDFGYLFPVPDMFCDPANLNDPCGDEALAAAGFVCQLPIGSGGSGPDVPRCVLPRTPVTVPSGEVPRPAQGESERHAVIVLIPEGASALGVRPNGDPSGVACSVDPFDRRTAAVHSLLIQLADDPGSDGNVEVCLAGFAGSSEPRYRFEMSPADCFLTVQQDSNDLDQLREYVEEIGRGEDTSGRNPWAAVIDASSRFDDFGMSAGEQRHILLIADGGVSADVAEVADALQQDETRARDAAAAAGVLLHVVEFERLDREEDCRPGLETGANSALASVACSSGGSYRFVEHPNDLSTAVLSVGRAMRGTSELLFDVPALLDVPPGPYKLSAAIDIRFSGGSLGLALDDSDDSGDRRVALFNRTSCSDAACYGDYVCDSSGVCAATENTE